MSQLFNNFFQNKKVFVTGHTGFKGSWLTLWLLELGARVKGYSLAPDHDFSNYYLFQLDKNTDSTFASINDQQRLRRELLSFQPDIIFHLAAQPLVLDSYLNPVETFQTNILGTAYLIEAARDLPGLESLVIITTDKCYENKETARPFREDDPLGGRDPYSASKSCTEIVSQSMYNSFFLDSGVLFATVRAGNVVGGGDWSKFRIFPDIARAVRDNSELEIRSPHAVRPWQHVFEPIRGYLELASRRSLENWRSFCGPWNFGPELDSHVSVEELLKCTSQHLPIRWRQAVPTNSVHEAGLLYLDITKAAEKLSWKPRFSLNETVYTTAHWYNTFLNSGESKVVRDFSIDQLKAYTAQACSA